jgi:hypothetical protein
MPNAMQLKFVESCQICGAILPESFRIARITEAAQKLSDFLNALLYHPGESVDYLKKHYGEPSQKAIFAILNPVECPNCHYQSDQPPRDVKEAAEALKKLLAQIESLAERLVIQ